MRKIVFLEPDSAEWKEWKEKCLGETKKLIADFNNGRDIKIKDLYKQRYIKNSFYFSESETKHFQTVLNLRHSAPKYRTIPVQSPLGSSEIQKEGCC